MKRSNAKSVTNVQRELSRFLRESLFTLRDDSGARLDSIRVNQIAKGRRGEEVFSITVPKKPGENWADSTALDVYVRLQAEAGVLQGLQKYAVYSYYSDDNETHGGRFLLAIQGSEETDDVETEGPDKEGQVRQLQRHLEAQARINTSMHMSSVQASQTIIARLSETVENMMAQRERMLAREEEMILSKHQMEMDAMVAAKRADAIVDIGKKVGMFIPAIANKIAGANLFPVQGSAITMMLKGLMGSIGADEKRLAALMNILTDEEKVVFFQLYEEVGKKSETVSEGGTTDDNNGQAPS